jgi:hypothetical protein
VTGSYKLLIGTVREIESDQRMKWNWGRDRNPSYWGRTHEALDLIDRRRYRRCRHSPGERYLAWIGKYVKGNEATEKDEP